VFVSLEVVLQLTHEHALLTNTHMHIYFLKSVKANLRRLVLLSREVVLQWTHEHARLTNTHMHTDTLQHTHCNTCTLDHFVSTHELAHAYSF